MTPEQVKGLLILARRAPLQNFDEAQAAGILFGAFTDYFERVWAAEKTAKDQGRAEKAAGKAKSKKATPETTTEA